jgi:hypothetical protein
MPAISLFYAIQVILLTHFIADFVCQTHWQASNKSKSNIALGAHVLTYTAVLFVASCMLFDKISTIFAFVMINGVLHFATDWCTSRMTSYLWEKKEIHNFFVVIGFDQLIHAITLINTLNIIIYSGIPL